MVSSRSNHHVKFEFLDTETEEDEEPNFVEMRLEVNELTQELFLRVTDYSDMDAEETQELWEGLVHDLKEIVGG